MPNISDILYGNIGDDAGTLAEFLRNRPATPAAYHGSVPRLASYGMLSNMNFNDSLGATGDQILEAARKLQTNKQTAKSTVPAEIQVQNTSAQPEPVERTVTAEPQSLSPSFYQISGPYGGYWNPLNTYKEIVNVQNPPPAPPAVVEAVESPKVKKVTAKTGDATIQGTSIPKRSRGTAKKKATTTATKVNVPSSEEIPNKKNTSNSGSNDLNINFLSHINDLLPLLAAGGLGYLLAK